MDEGQRKILVPETTDVVFEENNGKLVLISGPLIVEDSLNDALYGISIKAVKLKKLVQMYQWCVESGFGFRSIVIVEDKCSVSGMKLPTAEMFPVLFMTVTMMGTMRLRTAMRKNGLTSESIQRRSKTRWVITIRKIGRTILR